MCVYIKKTVIKRQVPDLHCANCAFENSCCAHIMLKP